MFYIEGTIDAIQFDSKTIRISILPSAEFLVKLDHGIKKALFIEETKGLTAVLIFPEKNSNGKEIVSFSIAKPKANCNLLLLGAKNNRNVLRMSVNAEELRKQSERENPDKCDPDSLHSIRFRVI